MSSRSVKMPKYRLHKGSGQLSGRENRDERLQEGDGRPCLPTLATAAKSQTLAQHATPTARSPHGPMSGNVARHVAIGCQQRRGAATCRAPRESPRPTSVALSSYACAGLGETAFGSGAEGYRFEPCRGYLRHAWRRNDAIRCEVAACVRNSFDFRRLRRPLTRPFPASLAADSRVK